MDVSIAKERPLAKKPFFSRSHKEWLWAYLFIAPTVIGLVLFLIGPIFFAVFISFTQWDNINPPVFIGLGNYVRMLADNVLHREIINSLLFAVIIVPLTVVIPIFVAYLLSVKSRWIGLFRAALFLPYITSGIAAAMVWQSMFNNRFGMINGWLRSLGLPIQPWLTEPQLVFTIIVMMAVWGGMGYYSIIYLVGLKNLPSSYHEAAEIDGANKLQILFRITIPLLTPQIFFVLTMSCIGTFQMFEAILVFGGAAHIRDGIRTVAFGIFERGFTFHQMGYASSNALVLLVMILMVTFLNFIMQKYWVHYDN